MINSNYSNVKYSFQRLSYRLGADLNRKLASIAAIVLVVLISLSLFLALTSFSNQTAGKPFYVGVEYAYGDKQTAQVQVSQIEALVNKVKDYTNLFVMGSVNLTFNKPALDEACDYIFNAKLNFIVLFTGSDMYNSSTSIGFNSQYTIFDWMNDAKLKYGDRFLGVYRYDEPGGNQLDNGSSQLIKNATVGANATYSDVANAYMGYLSFFTDYYLDYAPQMFTADYGLYWFDYQSNYSVILAEFVGNESRQRIIALDRGAAAAFNKDWGVIVNWKYDQPGSPYLESGPELYQDLSLAYSSGAKYAVVFSYPNVTAYGTLTEDHFAALQKFWNTLHSNPASFGSNKPEAAYIVPKDYGFGFRSSNDTIWGLFQADALSQEIFKAANNTLPAKYGSRFDILYDDPEVIAPVLKNYAVVHYWNQTVT